MDFIDSFSLFEGQSWIDVAGWVGAGFTLLAFSMRTIIVIRSFALMANVFFVTYGFYANLFPVLVLHISLFVLNILRLLQIRQDIARSKNNVNVTEWAKALAPFMKKEAFDAGDRLFSKGDMSDKFYIVTTGNVRLIEIDKRLGPGELFGEIGFLTDTKQRTLTAICDDDCQLLSADEQAFTKAYYQSPTIGMSMLKLVATRLNELATLYEGKSQ